MSTLVIVVVLAFLILALFVHRNIVSTRTYSVMLGLSPAAAAAAVESCFTRVSWANTEGPGLINKARVAKGSRTLVVSADVIDRGPDSSGSTTTEVRVWISNRNAIAGLTFSNGALKAAQVRTVLLRHPDHRGDGV